AYAANRMPLSGPRSIIASRPGHLSGRGVPVVSVWPAPSLTWKVTGAATGATVGELTGPGAGFGAAPSQPPAANASTTTIGRTLTTGRTLRTMAVSFRTGRAGAVPGWPG